MKRADDKILSGLRQAFKALGLGLKFFDFEFGGCPKVAAHR
jgi:hypothetical protein